MCTEVLVFGYRVCTGVLVFGYRVCTGVLVFGYRVCTGVLVFGYLVECFFKVSGFYSVSSQISFSSNNKAMWTKCRKGSE